MWLEIRDLAVRYEGAEVVKGVSMHLDEGQIVTLIGRNGAGKSTVLRALSGSNAHPRRDMVRRPPGRRSETQGIVKMGIVQVPQDRGLFPYMTVAENLRVGAYLRKTARRRPRTSKNSSSTSPGLRNGRGSRRHPQRRRAADAGHRRRGHVRAQGPAARRALHGAVAAHGHRDRQDHPGDKRDRHCGTARGAELAAGAEAGHPGLRAGDRNASWSRGRRRSPA